MAVFLVKVLMVAAHSLLFLEVIQVCPKGRLNCLRYVLFSCLQKSDVLFFVYLSRHSLLRSIGVNSHCSFVHSDLLGMC